MARIAINGLGRIGRAAMKIILSNQNLELVAVNDLLSPVDLAYLLKFDTVYGKSKESVSIENNSLYIGKRKIALSASKDPSELPWKQLGVDIVLECTGKFTKKDDLQKHITAGAKHAILSAPSKDEIKTIVPGVNASEKDDQIISTASCTTNCITPVVEIVGRRIGFEKAIMTTVHAYTSSQSIVDGPNKKLRRGRAAAMNIVPTSTGAAIATTQVLPQYKGKFDGVALRCPIPCGSISDLVFVTSRTTSIEEVNKIFTEEAQSSRYAEIMSVNTDEIVSSDIIQDSHGSIVDLTMTKVVDGNLLKIMSWYDNEWGYASQMVREAAKIAKMINEK